jgi:regulatory protein
MTIVSLKTEADGEIRKIELSDGSFFSFKPCYLPPVFIVDESLYTPSMGEGREITSHDEDAFRFAAACLRAEKSALRLIAHAEQNSFGLSRKLEKRRFETAYIRQVVSRLEELGLLDDRRYVQLWLEARISRRADSPRRLLFFLRARGIERDDAESGLNTALTPDAEWSLLLRYVKKLEKSKRFKKNIVSPKNICLSAGEDGFANDARSLKFHLKAEGFSPQAIERFVTEWNAA